MKKLLEWKIRTDKPNESDDLVFQLRRTKSKLPMKPKSLYPGLAEEFEKVLDEVGFYERKKSKSNRPRHTISLQSFRRFVKTTTSKHAGHDYSEWLVGHVGSTYYRDTIESHRETYLTKCMKHLTFLDYPDDKIDQISERIELESKNKEIQTLKTQISVFGDKIRELEESSDKKTQMMMGQFEKKFKYLQETSNLLEPLKQTERQKNEIGI